MKPVLFCDRSNLKFYEQLLLDHYQTAKNTVGYNMSPSSNGIAGYEYTDEQKAEKSARMRQDAKKYSWKGQELCLYEIAELESVDSGTLCRRVLEAGWELYAAVTTPLNSRKPLVEINGEFKTIQDWSAVTGITYSTIKGRISKGLSPEQAILPITPQETLLSFGGKTLNINQWSVEVGISASTISHRIRKLGWGVEDALLTPTGNKRKSKEVIP